MTDARRSLGVSVVGGLLLSQLVTLYITPVIYLYLEELREQLTRRREARRARRPLADASAASGRHATVGE